MTSPNDAISLVAGLGNPGLEYQATRHNVGFMVVEELARRWQARPGRGAHRAEIREAVVDSRKVLLARPLTYMNRSGDAVGGILRYYRLDPQQLLLVYDDMDLALGRLRLRPSGSAGGHNGVRSVIEWLDTEEFPRLRVGVGRPRQPSAVGHVLGRWTREEAAELPAILAQAADAAECAVRQGLLAAMNQFNGR